MLSKQSLDNRRRTLLGAGLLLLAYPLLRFVTFSLPRKPQHIRVTGPLHTKGFLVHPQFVLFSDTNEIWAVTRRCTHLGCTLTYLEGEQLLECPCHQSRFSGTGQVLRGPAEKRLPRYTVEQHSDPDTFTVVVR